MTRYISWNVNGLRAVQKKGFVESAIGAMPSAKDIPALPYLPEKSHSLSAIISVSQNMIPKVGQ